MPSIKRKCTTTCAIPAVKRKCSAPIAVPPTKVKPSPVFKLTPWYNRDEFRMVASSLFSEDINVKRWALNKIEVWQARTYPALPVYIDVTASLVRAELQDAVFAKRISYCSNGGLQLMYAQALIRFVNIASEIVEYREKTITLRTALRTLKLPDWLLDLRNSSSHCKMPSLTNLRYGASHVLDFLKREYWDKECEKHKNPFVPSPKEDNTELEKTICVLVRDCKSYAVQAHQCSPDECQSTLEEILKGLAYGLKEKHATVFDVLLRPGLFLLDDEDNSVLDGKGFMDSGNLKLPMSVLHLWAPVIGVINSLNKIPQFVTRLMELQMNMSRFHQKIACAWIWKLIEVVVHDGDETYDNSDPVCQVYTTKSWMFTWPSLLYVCSTNPSKLMLPIVTVIMDQICPPMPAKAKNELLMVMHFRLSGFNLDNEDVFSPNFDTFSDMQEYIAKEIEAGDDEVYLLSKAVWEDYTGPNLPLGVFLAPMPDCIGFPPNMGDGTVDQTSDIQDEQTQNAERTVNDPITTTSSTSVQVPLTSRADDLPEPPYEFTVDLY